MYTQKEIPATADELQECTNYFGGKKVAYMYMYISIGVCNALV